jgi:hypothetical protein
MMFIAKPLVGRMSNQRTRQTMKVITKPRVSKHDEKTWLAMAWGSSSPRADRGVQKALYFLSYFPYLFERTIACLTQAQRKILKDMLFIAMNRIETNLCAGGLTKTLVEFGIAKLIV